jgi:CheY-like chemotaxis protein
MAWCQTIHLQKHLNERFEALMSRIVDARLPLLNGPTVHSNALGKLTLRQTSTPAIAQQQTTEWFGLLLDVYCHRTLLNAKCAVVKCLSNHQQPHHHRRQLDGNRTSWGWNRTNCLALRRRAHSGGPRRCQEAHKGCREFSPDEPMVFTTTPGSPARMEKYCMTKTAEALERPMKIANAMPRRTAVRPREDMLAAGAHELRLPISHIKGFVTTLRRTDVEWDERSRSDFLAEIELETDRLTELVDSLLEQKPVMRNAAWRPRLELTHPASVVDGALHRVRGPLADPSFWRTAAIWQSPTGRAVVHRSAFSFRCKHRKDDMMTKQKILVVDDEAAMRKLLGTSLKANGYDVRAASDGAEALKMVDEHPDLVLLDLNMPGPNGLLVLEALVRFTEMPILVVSGRGRECDKVDALDLGADDYLVKPFSIPELLARVKAALRRGTKRPGSVKRSTHTEPVTTGGARGAATIER